MKKDNEASPLNAKLLPRQSTTTETRSLHLGEIKAREFATRPLSGRHVTALARSIVEVGLLHPLVIDEKYRLLAGAHRMAALSELLQNHEGDFQKLFPGGSVPVRIMHLGEVEDAERYALSVELSENEKRRNYSKKEIIQLVGRLKSLGYRSGSGKMQAGQKHIGPTLAITLGRSLRTVRRLLEEGSPSPRKTHDPVLSAMKGMQRAVCKCLSLTKNLSAGHEYRDFIPILEKLNSKVKRLSAM